MMTLDDLRTLLSPKNEDQRGMLPTEDLEQMSRCFVAALKEQLDRELHVTAIEAQQQADFFWATNKSAREEAGENEQGRVGTRVRILGATFVAEWYRNRFAPNGENGGKKKVFSTHIKKGRGPAYNMAHFKNEPGWSKEVIAIVEGRYAHLRQRATVLAKMRRALTEYEKLLDKAHQEAL